MAFYWQFAVSGDVILPISNFNYHQKIIITNPICCHQTIANAGKGWS
jgi:hypothetical protein